MKAKFVETFKSNSRDDQPVSDLAIGLANPARRALTGAGIFGLKQLSRFSESQIKQLHGIGPNALHQLAQALHAMGLSFNDK